MHPRTALDVIASIVKHVIYAGVAVIMAWLVLCGVIVAQTGVTCGIAEVGVATACLAESVITEPLHTVAKMAGASVDSRQATELLSACQAS